MKYQALRPQFFSVGRGVVVEWVVVVVEWGGRVGDGGVWVGRRVCGRLGDGAGWVVVGCRGVVGGVIRLSF